MIIVYLLKAIVFQDIISGKANTEQSKQNNLSVDDQVKDALSRSAVTIVAVKGRSHNYSDVLKSNPDEMKELYREQYQKAKDAREEFDNLSPQEKQKTTKELLDELSKYGGFRVL